jgi:hypothetical protein
MTFFSPPIKHNSHGFSLLGAGVSPRKAGFDFTPMSAGFVVDILVLVLEQVVLTVSRGFLPSLLFSQCSIFSNSSISDVNSF